MSADEGPRPRAVRKRLALHLVIAGALAPLVVGAAAAAGVGLLAPEILGDGTWLERTLTERGPVPHVAVWLFASELVFLLMRYRGRIRPELDTLARDPIPTGDAPLGEEQVKAMAARLAEACVKSGATRLSMEVLMTVALWESKTGGARTGEAVAAYRKTYRATARSAYLLPLGLTLGLAVVGNWGFLMDAGARADLALLTFPLALAALLALVVTKQAEDKVLANVEDYVLLRLMARLEFDESGDEPECEPDDEPDAVPDDD